MARKVSRPGGAAGYRQSVVRPREIRAQAIEVQMELFATLDRENDRDRAIIRDCVARIQRRDCRKAQLREEAARLEGARVA